ncbi:MAG: hypothetical protein PHE89_07415 [Alphaproteobacteria bacterium]|nr:hypothetical protein [Alphaproteobacteria bacterium]
MKIRIYKLLFLLVAFALSLSALLIYKFYENRVEVGNYLFSDVLEDMETLGRIEVKVDGNQYDLVLEEDLWRLQNSNHYYANYFVLNNLFTDIYNSQIFSKIEEPQENMFEDVVKVVFYNKKGKKIEKVSVGKRYNNDVYSFVKKGDEVFVASGVFSFPKEKISWIQQPSFSLNKSNIGFISLEEEGKTKDIAFKELPLMAREYLSFTYFEEVLPEKAFDSSKFPQQKKLTVESKDGLLVVYDIFIGEEYWVKLSVGTNKLPTAQVAEYVKENAFLYKGWYFKMPQEFAPYMFKF